jgi:GT2 family glycosyltransferase
MQRPSVHVVIVNWNAGPQLGECLQSFAAVEQDGVIVRITVVDNASTDGSCEGLTAAVPLSIIRNAENRGFGAACNQGAAGAESDYLLFLNPDTRLMPGSLSGPVTYLQSDQHGAVGIAGIQLLGDNGKVTRNTARMPTAWSMVGGAIGLDRLLPTAFPPHFVVDWAHDQTREVDQVMGAFFLVRRKVFEAVGGFDERFFVYFEDLDFAVRARAQGWSSVYLASAQAFHRGQGTTHGATARRSFYFWRSRIFYARKHLSATGAFAVTAATLLLEPIARLAARPSEATSTLQAIARLWAALPTILSAPSARPDGRD